MADLGALNCLKGAGGPHLTPVLILQPTIHVPCANSSRCVGFPTLICVDEKVAVDSFALRAGPVRRSGSILLARRAFRQRQQRGPSPGAGNYPGADAQDRPVSRQDKLWYGYDGEVP